MNGLFNQRVQLRRLEQRPPLIRNVVVLYETLFFAAGNVAQRYDTRSMARIRGAASALPLSGSALLAGGLLLAGAPPSYKS